MNSESSANNKRIAKNTLLLYFRMLLTMVVSLYTSRVVLGALGVEDYGIYNVVGGVVAMFSMLSGSLSAAISRFITFELGKGDLNKLNKIFSASVTIQLLLSLIVVLLIESIGVWFLNVKMTIPLERITAANWVLQFSITTFVINLISVPYNAVIIAHEKMSAFAYISILEVLCKLAISFLIMISPIDKLIFYAILMCIVSIIIRITYGYYCKIHFSECNYHFHWDKVLLKNMFGFAGWNFIGSSASILRDQGVNIILNLFCGPVVNAARGIAIQVNHAILGFVNNFMVALNPQITKSYAKGDMQYMYNLIFQGSRYSFYLLLFLSMPVIINTDCILSLWLKIVPDYTILFVKLTLLLAMIESISYPLITSMLATGKIKKYQILAGGLNLMNFPLSYLALFLGFSAYSTMYIAIVISIGCLFLRLLLLKEMLNLPSLDFIKKVLLNIFVVSVISSIVPIFIKSITVEQNVLSLLISVIACLISTSIVIFFLGCNAKERNMLLSLIKNKILKR